ncbi:MAG: gliding motility-associated protein GldE [Bacteroidales bacterium]|nr:gliding motility-associated protein GldE [Bacteroidales bacterium]
MEEPESDPHLWLPVLLLKIVTGNVSPELLLSLLVVIVLLLFSAMISGSEIAFFSLSPVHLKDIQSKNSSNNKIILSLLDLPKRLLATILITNNFVNVGIVILSAYISASLFDFSELPVLGFVVEVIAITTLILLFGEIMPKIFANQKPILFATYMARPLKLLMRFFYPLSSILVRTTTFIDKKLAGQNQEISMSDLSEAIDLTADKDTPEEETKILKGIVKFSDIEVKEIMRSRLDVVAIDSTADFKEVIHVVKDSGYSRIPVYEESFDKINGILYVKDLLPHLDKKTDFKWYDLLRPAFFVPENKKINYLLQEIQEKKIHMAIVVDEYGGTSGIVTLEDIIEEIVGEISDEFDSPEDEIGYSKIDDNNYVFEGKTSINDFCKIIGIDDSVFDEVKGDADSIAGLILELLGRIPEKNTVVSYDHFEFKVLTVDKRRIKMVSVLLQGEKEEINASS